MTDPRQPGSPRDHRQDAGGRDAGVPAADVEADADAEAEAPPTPRPHPAAGPFAATRAADDETAQRLQEFRFALVALTPRVVVTPAIVALNIGVFVVMVISGVGPFSPSGEALVQWGANFGPLVTSGEWWRMATAMFLHIGIIHLAMNMWVLWSAGLLVERLVGNVGFAVLYLTSGLLASLASVWWNPSVVSAGASGAVFGVYGALGGFLIRQRRAIPARVLAGLRVATVVFVGYNLAYGLLLRHHIDNAAHLGGLLTGLLCGLALAHPLTRPAGRRRWRRNLLVGVLGAGALVAGTQLVPNHMGRYQAALQRLARVEREVIGLFNRSLEREERGEISKDELADVLQERILPPWQTARRALEQADRLPPPLDARARRLLRYVELRQRGWTLLAEALRQRDADKARQAEQLQAEARAVLEQINAGAGP